MKYLLLLFLFASESHACSSLADLISLYNGKEYTAAYMELTNRCGDQELWDAHDTYWQGKISEAYGDTGSAVHSYEFLLKLKKMGDEDEETNATQLFFKTEYYPDSIYRLAKIYRKVEDKKNYKYIAEELKKTSTEYYNKLQYHSSQIDKDKIKKTAHSEMINSDIDMVTGIKIIGEFAVATTDAKHIGMPSPMVKYFLKYINGKWEVIDTSPMITDWKYEKYAKDIPQELLDYNAYTEKK